MGKRETEELGTLTLLTQLFCQYITFSAVNVGDLAMPLVKANPLRCVLDSVFTSLFKSMDLGNLSLLYHELFSLLHHSSQHINVLIPLPFKKKFVTQFSPSATPHICFPLQQNSERTVRLLSPVFLIFHVRLQPWNKAVGFNQVVVKPCECDEETKEQGS